MGKHTYTIRTDAELMTDIRAVSMDAAARQFAASQEPAPARTKWSFRGIRTVRGLIAKIERIGDGAWIWIESDDDPNGGRIYGGDRP